MTSNSTILDKMVIIKRDNETAVDYSVDKIKNAIHKAFIKTNTYKDKSNEELENISTSLAMDVENKLIVIAEENRRSSFTVEEIQEVVEDVLFNFPEYKDVAKEYIRYRVTRNKIRESENSLMLMFKDFILSDVEDVDALRENANIAGETPMGQLFKFGSESSKLFANTYLISPDLNKLKKDGYIHIHDFDFMAYGTTTCSASYNKVMIFDPELYDEPYETPVSGFDKLFDTYTSVYQKDINTAITIDLSERNISILSEGRFVKILFCTRRKFNPEVDKMFRISIGVDVLDLTDKHIVPVLVSENSSYIRNNIQVDLLQTGDVLICCNEDDMNNNKYREDHTIQSIKQIEYDGYVYDFETENNYFVTNGYLVHNCCQIDIKSLLERGFNTGHGELRTPNSILSYSSLACIALQSNQCDQHGGQSIPNFDYGLAPGVAKSFIKRLIEALSIISTANPLYLEDTKFYKCSYDGVKNKLLEYYNTHGGLIHPDHEQFIIDVVQEANYNLITEIIETVNNPNIDDIKERYELSTKCIRRCINTAYNAVERDTYQAMEALVHNFNTLKSRSGGQVPFSSINFGTDITTEGRMVSINLLKAIDAGLGCGETPIFPITILKVKKGINFYKDDPNYDIFEMSCKVSAKRLFPKSNWGQYIV